MNNNGIKITSYVIIGISLLILLIRLDEFKRLSSYESSPIDWCETNYAVHESIVEFWNAISSIPIALVAFVAHINEVVPAQTWRDFPKVILVFILIVMIGVGSTYFHATLSVTGQIMDEMSIFWLVAYSACIVAPPGKYQLLTDLAFEPIVFVAFTLSTTVLGLFLPIVSHFVVLSCVPFGLYIHRSAFARSRNAGAKRRFHIGFLVFCAAWTAWLIDRLACSSLQKLPAIIGFQPQLHAVWHILIGIMCYILFGVCIEFRNEFRGVKVQSMV